MLCLWVSAVAPHSTNRYWHLTGFQQEHNDTNEDRDARLDAWAGGSNGFGWALLAFLLDDFQELCIRGGLAGRDCCGALGASDRNIDPF